MTDICMYKNILVAMLVTLDQGHVSEALNIL